MDSKERARKLKKDIPAIFLALKDKETPEAAKIAAGDTILYDKDIREPLFEFLENTYGKIRILEEKTMGRSRADIVMVTEDALWGIEIKSDADTYARLAGQVKDYDRYFDYLKIGPYIAKHGPLNKKTTNQRLYEIEREYDPVSFECIKTERKDITFKFWRKD